MVFYKVDFDSSFQGSAFCSCKKCILNEVYSLLVRRITAIAVVIDFNNICIGNIAVLQALVISGLKEF